MNHHHHADPAEPPPSRRQPPQIHHPTTTTEILKTTTNLFLSHLVTFLSLSSFLLMFRSNVHTASHYLSLFIDHDPSLKSLINRLDLAPTPPHHHPHTPLHHRRRRPFLHLSRVGTLDDDFFSGDDSDFDRSLFYPSSKKHVPNSTFFTLFDFEPNRVRPGSIGFKHNIDDTKNFSVKGEDEVRKKVRDGKIGDGTNGVVDFRVLVKGIELGRDDASSLFMLVGVLSAAYAYVVLAFIITYTWILSIVFIQVVDHFLGNYRSLFRTIWDGANVGIKRISGFILMKWAVRDALAQLMGIYFFGEIEDQYVFFKVFLRMKFMPFANVAPWVKGHEWESGGFVLVWFLSDLVIGLIFAVDAWVAVSNPRMSGREIVKEGCHLLAVLFFPATELRWLEAIVCGYPGRWALRWMFGDVCALILQSLMEVYFMVAWLVFYFSARHKEDAALGRTFGRAEMEGLLEVVR